MDEHARAQPAPPGSALTIPGGATPRRLTLFVDESGDPALCPTPHAGLPRRFMGLIGVVFSAEAGAAFDGDLRALKLKHFGREDVMLHRVDILHARGAFSRLTDSNRRAAFDHDLLELMEAADYSVLAVVIDKYLHATKNGNPSMDAYGHGLGAMVERYLELLREANAIGDVVMEQRGKKEDQQMRAVYYRMWQTGASVVEAGLEHERLTSRKLKIEPKKANVSALQLADLLAHPITRWVLREKSWPCDCGGPFAERIAHLIATKKFARGAGEGWELLE